MEPAVILSNHNLKKTAFREKLLSVFMSNSERALSNSEIELALGEHDRITLYRTLKSFEKAGIIHQASNHQNIVQYAICHSDCNMHNHNDDHIHFSCESCGTTSCLNDISSEVLKLPKGYKIKEITLSVTGVCPQCN